MKRSLKITIFALFVATFGLAQPSVQSAWRAYTDYTNSVQEGKPDFDYLKKAKEKIDLALQDPEAKEKPKTQMYVCKIYYSLFQYNWEQEKKKLSATLNKTQAAEEAYGNVSTKEFEIAGEAMQKVMETEMKEKEKPYTMELIPFAMNMMTDMQNLAIGRFKVKKYEEAMEIFADSYSGYKMMGKKDTSLISYALLSAERAKKFDKVLEYGKLMKDDKVANADTYMKLHFAHLELKDTANAELALKEGLELFPNEKGLILNYIDMLLKQNKGKEAMDYIAKAIEKDPKNCGLYIAMGGIYADMANPKSPKTGQDTTKPANFEELMKKTEDYYLKAVECAPNTFEPNFNLGATYNNWGGWYSNNASPKNDFDKKAKEHWLNAVKYLEKALEIEPNDKGVMRNLLRLYRLTEQTDKVAPMQERLKK